MATSGAEARIRIAAEDATANAFASVTKSLSGIGNQATKINALLGSLGISLSAAAVTLWFRGIVDGVDALNDLKDATGASIENLSALEDIAKRNGTSTDSVGSAIIRLNKAITEGLDPASESASLFKRLGLNAKELAELDPAEALLKVAQALDGVKEGGAKARIETQLLNKSTKELAPFLKDLAETGKLNATVTTEQAEAAEKFNKELFAWQKNIEDGARAITNDMVPALTEMLRVFNQQGLTAAIDHFGNKVLDWEGNAMRKNIASLVGDVEDAQKRMEFGRVSIFNTPAERAQQQRELEAATAKLVKAQGAYYKVTDLQGGRGRVNPAFVTPAKLSLAEIGGDGKTKAGPAGTNSATSELQKYAETLRMALERTQELSAVETARLRIAENLGRQSSTVLQRQIMADAAQIDAAKLEESIAKARAANTEAALASLDVQIRDNDALAANNRSLADQLEEMGLTADALDALRVKRLEAAIAQERLTLIGLQNIEGEEKAVAQLERKIRLLERERDLLEGAGARRGEVAAASESKEFAKTLNSDVKNALSNAFRDSKQPLQAFGDALGNVIYTRMTNSLGNSLADLLVGNGKPGGGGGLFGDAVGWIGSLFGGFRADGGPVRKGVPYMVGERGPEMFVPPGNGSIVPNGKMGGGFAPVTNITLSGGASTAENAAMLREAIAQNNRVWSQQLQQMGVLPS